MRYGLTAFPARRPARTSWGHLVVKLCSVVWAVHSCQKSTRRRRERCAILQPLTGRPSLGTRPTEFHNADSEAAAYGAGTAALLSAANPAHDNDGAAVGGGGDVGEGGNVGEGGKHEGGALRSELRRRPCVGLPSLDWDASRELLELEC